jgi:hypothetical protein
VFFLLVAWVSGVVVPRRAKLASLIPRDRIVGSTLMFAAVAWLAFAAIEMIGLDAESKLRLVILLLVPLLTVLFASTLDFLVSRALGGLLLLTCARLVDLAFYTELPVRPLFSAVCYLVLVCGFVLVIAPWKLRDLLEQCAVKPAWRWGTAVPALLAGVFFLVYGAISFCQQAPPGV